MIGTDWPMIRGRMSYAQCVFRLRGLVQDWSPTEQRRAGTQWNGNPGLPLAVHGLLSGVRLTIDRAMHPILHSGDVGVESRGYKYRIVQREGTNDAAVLAQGSARLRPLG